MTARGGARAVPAARAGSRARGGPLVMLVMLLAGWGAIRAVWWEDPFAGLARPLVEAAGLPLAGSALPEPAPLLPETAAPPGVGLPALADGLVLPLALPFAGFGRPGERRVAAGVNPQVAAGHHLLWYAALGASRRGEAAADAPGSMAAPLLHPAAPAPFLPAPAAPAARRGRWSLDAWAFWRQGSDAAPVSQGRVPIYGASQAGAVLQYRLAAEAARDPRLYARAYRALVRRGESELALGASLRPLPRVPLRLAGEVRYTAGAASDDWRPAAYVVTELAPVQLPLRARLEAYGQAGWVGGPQPTPFADGQASVTREVPEVAALTDDRLRLSLGAAAWGGAQEDAQRIDIGPTLRLDLTVGEVPARVSIDWRERVGGEAGPESGLAATLSTQF